jgi:hypothetical protein
MMTAPATTVLQQDPTRPQRATLAKERTAPTRGFSPGLLPEAVQIEDCARAVITACADCTLSAYLHIRSV